MSTLSRRTFLRRSAQTSAAGLLAGPAIQSVLWASPAGAVVGLPKARGRIVQVFLRGGMDGLTAVVPAGEAAYYTARPTIAVPANKTIAVDPRFGLHPALAPLADLYRQGDLAIVHAMGNASTSRSHFEVQAAVELGSVANASGGWITRHLAATAPLGGSPVRAVALSAATPASLRACRECVATPALAGLGLGGRSGLLTNQRAALAGLYEGATSVDSDGRTALAALDALSKLVTGPGANADATAVGGDEGVDEFHAALNDAARLLTSDLGIEAITIDYGGWDLHSGLGNAEEGVMAAMLASLAKGLAKFWDQLRGAGVDDVTVIVMSEFGRRVAENGSRGADHGSGQAAFFLGKGLRGGRVITDWPGLDAAKLDRGDLRGTTDYRDVLAELLQARHGNTSVDTIFAGRPGKPVGLV